MEFFDKLWEWAPEVFPFLIKASVVTLQVTAGSLALALVLGIFVAVARISSFKLLSYPALIYTDVMRGTPALVQLFIIYFGLSDLGLEFDPISAAIIGLGLNGAAYVGEIVPYDGGITPDNVRFLYHSMVCEGCLGNCIHAPEDGMFPCVARLDRDHILATVREIMSPEETP